MQQGGEDSDDWETVEEVNVIVKLSGVIRDEFMKNLNTPEGNHKATSMGLMSDEPLVQIGNDLFRGKYGHPCGTHLILESCQKDGKPDLKYVCTSDKELVMNKLYVQERLEETTTADDSTTNNDGSEMLDTQTDSSSHTTTPAPHGNIQTDNSTDTGPSHSSGTRLTTADTEHMDTLEAPESSPNLSQNKDTSTTGSSSNVTVASKPGL